MAVTLALFRRPDGRDQALDAFLRRYVAEHLPLVERVPGLRSPTVHRVTHTYMGNDLVLTNHMAFDDRAALDAAMASDEMRRAGRNLRDIAPDLVTLVVLEDEAPSGEPVSDEKTA